MTDRPFWETTPLAQMSLEQWESLCDGCARCCLQKLQDAYTDRIYYTDVACRLLDRDQCRCSQYAQRQALIPDCVVLRPEQMDALDWLPSTCAYRLLDEGKPLFPWHPLISGDPASVHLADISVRDFAVSEEDVDDADLEDRIIPWVRVD